MRKTIAAAGNVRQAAMEGSILRCRCGDPEAHKGSPCPKGVEEPVGTLAFTHTDWRVRLAHWILSRSGWRFHLWVYGRAV